MRKTIREIAEELAELIGDYKVVSVSGKEEFLMRCPLHPDNNPSFYLNPDEGIWHCFGCEKKGGLKDLVLELHKEGIISSKDKNRLLRDIAKALGSKRRKPVLKKTEKVKDKRCNPESIIKVKKAVEELKKQGWKHKEYPFIDLTGKLRYKKHRFDKDGNKKVLIEFTQTEDCRQFFYNLYSLKGGWYDRIFFAEGEKCAEAVIEAMPESDDKTAVLGFSNIKAEIEYLKEEEKKGNLNLKELFAGKEIVIFEDNDEIGRKKASHLREFLLSFTSNITSVRFRDKEEGYDIADWLKEGKTLDEALEVYGIRDYGYSFIGNVISAFKEEIKPIESILGKLNIPKGKLSLFAGAGAVGKSTTMLTLCSLLLLEGKTFSYFTFEDDPNSVLLYRFRNILGRLIFKTFLGFSEIPAKGETLELLEEWDGLPDPEWHKHWEWVEQLGIKIRKNWHKSAFYEMRWALEDFEKGVLFDRIKERFISGVDVVILDPVGMVIEEENNNSQVQELIRGLNKLLKEFPDKGIWLVHHLRKEMDLSKVKTVDELFKFVRGASALSANSRYASLVLKNDRGGWDLINFKNNYFPKTSIRIEGVLKVSESMEIPTVTVSTEDGEWLLEEFKRRLQERKERNKTVIYKESKVFESHS